MKHLLCEWVGEKRLVPKFGTFKKGDKIYLPENVAQEFKKKKLVKILVKKKKTKEK